MKAKTKGILEMLLCALLWSIAGLFFKWIPWNSFVIAGWRSLIAAVVIFLYLKLSGGRFRINKKILLGGLFNGILYLCFSLSNKLTTAANAIVLQFTAPIFLMIFSTLLLREHFKLRDVLAALGTLFGIALCFLDEMEGGHLWGNLVAILAGAMMAGMYLVVGHLEPEDRLSAIIVGDLVAVAAGLPFMAFTEVPVDSAAVLSILALGIFQLGISYILYAKSTETCPPLACSLLGALEPLLNPVWVALFYGEVPGLLALAGGLIVILSVTVWCIVDGKKEAAEAE